MGGVTIRTIIDASQRVIRDAGGRVREEVSEEKAAQRLPDSQIALPKPTSPPADSCDFGITLIANGYFHYKIQVDY